jgi:hypothetical protein
LNVQERKRQYAKKQKVESVKFNFDLPMMNIFCSYVLSENVSIHKSSMSMLQILFGKLDESIFNNNQELILRFQFCKEALTLKLDKKISGKELILKSIYGLVGSKFEMLDSNNFNELSNGDVKWVEDSIASCMNIMYINNSIIELSNACTEYMNSDYTEKMDYALKVKSRVNDMQTQFRRNDVDRDSSDTIFKLSEAESSVSAAINRMQRPSYKLVTGMQGLNDMLAGGFEGSRVYCFLGLPGEGKTLTLMNLLYQLKKYNSNYICKDPTKRPCIVLLTMENQIHEEISGLFNIGCTNENMSTYSTEEVLDMMNNNSLDVSENNPIDIIVKFKPINSVDTNYLYTLTENLEDEGYEVIAFLQDYIKRIKPVLENKEERFRLGNVINEFKNFAIYKDIPVITASQINRDGAKLVDDGRNSNKNDLVRKVGRTNIGESSAIDENLDGTFFIVPEMYKDKKYMGIKLTKHRYRIKTNVVSIYQPFVESTGIKMEEDVGCIKPVYKESLVYDRSEIERNFGETNRFSVNREVKDISDIEKELNSGKILSEGTIYGKNTINALAFTIPKIQVCKRVVCERVNIRYSH